MLVHLMQWLFMQNGVSNLQLVNNTIIYSGQSKGKTLNHPVHIDDCKGAVIEK